MNLQKIIDNAPEVATHAAFYDHQPDVKYIQTDTDVINCWYHWVGETRHIVDYDFTVVFDNIRCLSDIKLIVKMSSMLNNITTSVSKSNTVHPLTCINVDEFLENELSFFTSKQIK